MSSLANCQLSSSDADSDVLADYVIALMRADTPESELRSNAVECLEDFLKDSMFDIMRDALFTSVGLKLTVTMQTLLGSLMRYSRQYVPSPTLPGVSFPRVFHQPVQVSRLLRDLLAHTVLLVLSVLCTEDFQAQRSARIMMDKKRIMGSTRIIFEVSAR